MTGDKGQGNDGTPSRAGSEERAPAAHTVARLSRGPAYGAGLAARVGALRRAAAEFLYGMAGYEFAQQANRMRHEAGTLLMLVTFGDMIGLPVLPPYYSLRLLPYVVPEVATWKRQLLREKHPLEKEEFDLIEM